MRTAACTRLLPPQEIKEVRTIFITSPKNMVQPGNIFLMPELLSDEKILHIKEVGIDKYFNQCGMYNSLTMLQADSFAWNDGFRPEGSTKEKPVGAFELMYRWWMQNNDLPFCGTVTYW